MLLELQVSHLSQDVKLNSSPNQSGPIWSTGIRGHHQGEGLSVCLSGIMGLQWAKHLGSAVKVTVNDISEVCIKMIKENCELNSMRVDGGPRVDGGLRGPRGPDGAAGEAITTVEVTKMDANVLLHLRAFDYM